MLILQVNKCYLYSSQHISKYVFILKTLILSTEKILRSSFLLNHTLFLVL